MSEISFDITMEGDREGYVTFECPFCGSSFGLRADEVKNDEGTLDKIYCPYCGLNSDSDEFLPQEVIEQAEKIVHNYAVEQFNQAFGKMAKSMNGHHGIIKMTYKPLKKKELSELYSHEGTEEAFECKSCKHHVKVLYVTGNTLVYCPNCGVNT